MLFSLSLLSLFNALRFLTNSKFQFNTDDYLFHETSKLHLHYFLSHVDFKSIATINNVCFVLFTCSLFLN